MAKSKQPPKMSAFRQRILQQASTAHVDELKPEQVPEQIPTPTPEPKQTIQKVQPKTKQTTPAARRRRSQWANPYPNAEPFQASTYFEDEDLLRIKELRLKLRFTREWMVVKYAIEKLAKEQGIIDQDKA